MPPNSTVVGIPGSVVPGRFPLLFRSREHNKLPDPISPLIERIKELEESVLALKELDEIQDKEPLQGS
jgi:hypothetical protein